MIKNEGLRKFKIANVCNMLYVALWNKVQTPCETKAE